MRADLLDWLGIKHYIDFTKAKPLGRFFGVLLTLFAICTVIAAIGTMVHFLANVLTFPANHEAIRNIGLILIAALGAPFVVWRAVVLQKQADVAEQSHITDQLNKAVENLGAVRGDNEPNMEMRIGAIYALSRISEDSERDHIPIMEILTAYVREDARAKTLEPSEDLEKSPKPRADIQTVLDVIGRRNPKRVALEHAKKFRLNLSGCNLDGANFKGGEWTGALLEQSRFEGANFRDATLVATRFTGSLLNFADYWGANMQGAALTDCVIDRTASFTGIFGQAKNTYGMCLLGADISSLELPLAGENFRPSIGSVDTILQKSDENTRQSLIADMDKFWIHKQEIDEGKENFGDVKDIEAISDRLREKGFLYWLPSRKGDWETDFGKRYFYKDLGLIGFPYDDTDPPSFQARRKP